MKSGRIALCLIGVSLAFVVVAGQLAFVEAASSDYPLSTSGKTFYDIAVDDEKLYAVGGNTVQIYNKTTLNYLGSFDTDGTGYTDAVAVDDDFIYVSHEYSQLQAYYKNGTFFGTLPTLTTHNGGQAVNPESMDADDDYIYTDGYTRGHPTQHQPLIVYHKNGTSYQSVDGISGNFKNGVAVDDSYIYAVVDRSATVLVWDKTVFVDPTIGNVRPLSGLSSGDITGIAVDDDLIYLAVDDDDGYLYAMEKPELDKLAISSHSDGEVVTSRHVTLTGVADFTHDSVLIDVSGLKSVVPASINWWAELELNEGENTISVMSVDTDTGDHTEYLTITLTSEPPSFGYGIAIYNPLYPACNIFTKNGPTVGYNPWPNHCFTKDNVYVQEGDTITVSDELIKLEGYGANMYIYITNNGEAVGNTRLYEPVKIPGYFAGIDYTSDAWFRMNIPLDIGDNEITVAYSDNPAEFDHITFTITRTAPQDSDQSGQQSPPTTGQPSSSYEEMAIELSVTSHADGDQVGQDAITLEGSAEPGSIVRIKVNGHTESGYKVTSDEWGQWSADINLDDGENTIDVLSRAKGEKFGEPYTITLNYSG